MPNFRLIAAAALVLGGSIPALALAAPSLHAGEWETRTDGGAPNLICMHQDHVFDQATMSGLMAQSGQGKCTPGQYGSFGAVTTYDTICDVGGGKLTVKTSITSRGPNAYTTRSQSHFEGGAMKIPDMDITQVSRRLGPCRPTDRQSPY